MLIRTVLAAMSAATLLSAGAAQAAWPEKPITIVVPFAAGGGNDVAARTLAPLIEKYLGGGAKVEVTNKVGAGGEIGFAAIADAAPDGYTIGFIATPNLVTILAERQARYSLDKIDPLVNVVDDPAVWVVKDDSPFKTVGDAVKRAEAAPNTLTVGSTGVGSKDHLAMLRIQKAGKAKFTHVPFPGFDTNQKALLAGKITIAGAGLGEALRLRASNPVRILGVMSSERAAVAPDIPTFKEQGYPIVIGSMRGIGAPQGLPPDVRAKLVDAATKSANDAEFVKVAANPDSYQPLRVLGPDEFSKELKDAEAEFRALWKDDPWLK